MGFVRAGGWLALWLLAACEPASSPYGVRAALASCNAAADCANPPGKCAAVACTMNACTPAVNATCACAGPADCDDGDPCTTDTCVANRCSNMPAAGAACCSQAADCTATPNACQAAASCVSSSCTFVSSGMPGCCNSASDCLGAACSANTCTCSGGGKYCPGLGCVQAGACCSAMDCDSARSRGGSCSAGVCSYTGCKAGFGDCVQTGANLNGCETRISTSTSNCGACGRACSSSGTSGVVCAGGLCTSSCNPNLGNCVQPAAPSPDDGCETDLNSSPSSCGGCGRACASTDTAAISCSAGLCTSSCLSGFGNCSRPAFPSADDGCESDESTDVDNCGGCAIVCAAPINACQVTNCASASCGYVSSGGSGCCDTVGQCAPNLCQNARCMANACVFTARAGVAGCCTTPASCPAQTDPCRANTCLNNQCGTVAIACSDMGADLGSDMALVDLKPPADLANDPAPDLAANPEPEDLLAPPDLSRSIDGDGAGDGAPIGGNLSLTGGGGCAFGGADGGAGALVVVVLWFAMRRRRA